MTVIKVCVCALGLVAAQFVGCGWAVAGDPAVRPDIASGSCVASWTSQPVSKKSKYDNVLLSISGTSPSSRYATGRGYSRSDNTYFGRILRNTGSGWKDIPVPDVGGHNVMLTSSLSTQPGTAWVGGSYSSSTAGLATLIRIVGSNASVVALPPMPAGTTDFDTQSGLALASAGGSDLWAAADFFSNINNQVTTVSLAYHRTAAGGWDSTIVPASYLDAVAALSPTVALVGGDGLYQVSGGTATPVALPGDPPYVSQIVNQGPDDVWVLGHDLGGGNQIIDHFDGTAWVTVPMPGISGTPTVYTLAVASNGVLWATGTTAPSETPEHAESWLARYDPGAGTWAGTLATSAATATNQTGFGATPTLLALANGDVYTAGFGLSQADPFVGKLCQLPVGLSSGAPLSVTTRTLGDGVLVTSPKNTTGTVTVTDSTGLLTTGPLSAGGGAALTPVAAATYDLTSTSGGTATLAVPPIGFSHQANAQVLFASAPAPAGFGYDVQARKVGSTPWADVSPNGATTETLRPAHFAAGHWQVRSRVHQVAGGTATDWSPPVTVVVP